MQFADWKNHFEASMLFNFGLSLEDVGLGDDYFIALLYEEEDSPSAAAHKFGAKYRLMHAAIRKIDGELGERNR